MQTFSHNSWGTGPFARLFPISFARRVEIDRAAQRIRILVGVIDARALGIALEEPRGILHLIVARARTVAGGLLWSLRTPVVPASGTMRRIEVGVW